jgi:hypothetical protein
MSCLGTSESRTLERSCIRLILTNVDDLNTIERRNSLRRSHPTTSTQIRDMLITNYLDRLDCSCHPVCRTPFASRIEISTSSRTSFRHFRRMISDATDDRSDATVSSSFGGALVTFIGAVTGSIIRTRLRCNSPVPYKFAWKGARSCYRRAVFAGDDLAVQSGPR